MMKLFLHIGWFLCLLVAPRSSIAIVTNDFSHYQVILDRAPFGTVQEASGDTNQAVVPPQQSFVRDWRLVGMTEEEGEIQVGLVNIQNNNYYLLLVGDEVEGVTVLAADYVKESVQLQSGKEKQWLGMGEAGSDGSAPGGPAVGAANGGGESADRSSSARRASRRRETIRVRDVEPPTLSGAELEKHLQDYQMELIRKGDPPLPIPLTKEMDNQLVKEGVLPPLK